jgi:hypothetical protein
VWWVVIVVVALVLSHGNLVVAGVIAAVPIAVFYRISLARHPFKVCRSCGGTGRTTGTMFFWSHRQCTNCGGQSRHRRFGTQRIYGDNPTWAERIASGARDSRRNRPR